MTRFDDSMIGRNARAIRSLRSRGFTQHPALTTATVFLIAAGVAATARAQAEDKKKGVYTVTEDGYTETIDPAFDYKSRLPRVPPRTPADSLKAFHLVPGVRLEQVAAEPLVRDPVDLSFDENGRLYVAEIISYSENNSSKYGSPTGRVSVLDDTDHDGRFDKSTVFVDQLVWPTGVLAFDGGVFVVAAPDVLYCKDTTGDGKADVREVVITGFGISNCNALPGSLRFGLDNRIHGMTSTQGGLLRAVRWAKHSGTEAKPVQARGRDFSFHPRTGELRLESGGSQFGMTFDAWGRKFESSNSAPIEMVMYDERYIARNPYLTPPPPRTRIWTDGNTVYRTSRMEPWRLLRTELRVSKRFSGPVEGGGTAGGYFTGACGVTIYTGHALPAEFQGNSFTGEGANNIVHRLRLEPDGVGFTAHRTEKDREFLASDEVWFRPIQFAVGPEGALYMTDMYREIHEHPGAVPPSAKKLLDLTTGNDRGRIYRIVPDGFAQPPPPRLGRRSTDELATLLAHPNSWHRITASRLLYERHDRGAIQPLTTLAAQSAAPLGRMHAMYALAGLSALTADTVLARLDDAHPRVREHAVRLAEGVLADAPAVREKLYAMVGDDDLRVRYQLAFTLGEIAGARATRALAAIAARDVRDRWIRLAVLSSSLGRAGELATLLAADAAWRATQDGRALLEQLAEQVGLQNRGDQVAELFQLLDRLGRSDDALARSLVRGLAKGLETSGSPLRGRLAAGGGARAGQLLGELIQQATATATDTAQPADRRATAIRSLGLASFDQARRILPALLDSRQPQVVQVAALRTLSRFADASVAEIVLEAWVGFSPKVRGEAAEALFARPERLRLLLGAIDKGVILPSQLDPARIRFLLAHADAKIRAEAGRLLGQARLAPRAEVVARFRDVLKMTGDAPRGKVVFKRECSKCHRLEGVGVELGLPLESVGNRGAETILLSVLDPNREVNPAYLNYLVVTEDGRSLSGIIAAETATSITLKRAEGETDTVLRANIDQLQSSGMSIMPEGLEKVLTRQEMADVIAYLLSIE